MTQNRKIIYSMMVSLDGYIETRDHRIDWSVPDPTLQEHFNQQDKEIDTHLYGRRLYENMASYWGTIDTDLTASEQDIEYGKTWKKINKIVFSRTLDEVHWNSKLIKTVTPEEIKRLKKKPGKHMD